MIMQKKLERRRRRREESALQRGPAGDAPDEESHKEQVGISAELTLFNPWYHTSCGEHSRVNYKPDGLPSNIIQIIFH